MDKNIMLGFDYWGYVQFHFLLGVYKYSFIFWLPLLSEWERRHGCMYKCLFLRTTKWMVIIIPLAIINVSIHVTTSALWSMKLSQESIFSSQSAIILSSQSFESWLLKCNKESQVGFILFHYTVRSHIGSLFSAQHKKLCSQGKL